MIIRKKLIEVALPLDEINKAGEEIKGKNELEAVIAYLQVLGTARK